MNLPMLSEPVARNEVQIEPESAVEGKVLPSESCGCVNGCAGLCIDNRCRGLCY